jgi:hypothetical protein
MTENNHENNDQLGNLFEKASQEEWIPLPGFESRVIARLDREKQSSQIGDIAWRLLPYTIAVSVAVTVLALMSESFEMMYFQLLSDPFTVENLIALL